MISEQVTVTSQSHNKFFCSWYLFLLFLISCGLPSIWPHVISRNNVHPILLPPLLIGLAKIQWSYCSSIYRCKLQVEPLLSQLWCQELSACLSYLIVCCLIWKTCFECKWLVVFIGVWNQIWCFWLRTIVYCRLMVFDWPPPHLPPFKCSPLQLTLIQQLKITKSN